MKTDSTISLISRLASSISILTIVLSLIATIVVSSCGGGGGGGTPLSSAKAITAYSLNNVTGTINENNKTIAVTMPYGTNVTALVATITATGIGISVEGVTQVSGTTANNFTNPVNYTVTAEDGSSANYTVTVTVAQNPAKAITAYSLNGVTGTIDEANKMIAVTMPYGTNVTALVATFTITGISVSVGGVTQISGTTVNNFTDLVTYTVTAADGSNVNYTVTVSIPGVNWTTRTSGTTDGLSDITWSGTQFVVVGGNSNAGGANPILTSPDGITWTARASGTTASVFGGRLTGVTWSGTQFVAVGQSPSGVPGYGGYGPPTIITSPDGITWTARTTSAIGNLYAVIWTGTQFVAVGYDGSSAGFILTSSDGITWTARASGTSRPLYGVAWSGTTFVAVGSAVLLNSPDGITWNLSPYVNVGLIDTLADVTWSGTQFVVVGSSMTTGGAAPILTSPDGVGWMPHNSVTTNYLHGITWSGTQFVAVGRSISSISGFIITSPDGVNWTEQTSGTTNALISVIWSGTRFVAVGENGTILTSP